MAKPHNSGSRNGDRPATPADRRAERLKTALKRNIRKRKCQLQARNRNEPATGDEDRN